MGTKVNDAARKAAEEAAKKAADAASVNAETDATNEAVFLEEHSTAVCDTPEILD